MDFEQNNNLSGPVESQSSEAVPGLDRHNRATDTTRKGIGWKIFWGVVLALSVLANAALFLILIGLLTVFAARPKRAFTEEVVREGPRSNKIVVINIEGLINVEQAESVYRQLKAARQDEHVKGMIVRVNSPGGTIAGSDHIYQEILKYREEQGIPTIAFMQNMAASGGYYTSVACEKIVAEPMTITGSIGVIMGHLVLKELLEDKLGIKAVILKEGDKKDWPSSFRVPEPNELQYLQERLLTPAYERFVQVVAEGRKESLTPDEVRPLADGSIFFAQDALDVGLIDQVGYLDEAIELVKSLAGIKKAQVVEYHEVFSLATFLSYRRPNSLVLGKAVLHELSTPQILYLWKAY